MRIGGLLVSVSAAALITSAAAAQVSVPLPRPGRTAPSTPVPAPQAPTNAPSPGQGVPVPLPGRPAKPLDSSPLPEPPALPVIPIGKHGRPDINPYERDIDMTVPLTFENRSLGDIAMRLTADDRFLIDSATFARLMRSILNQPAQAVLTERLKGFETFGPDDLATTGVQLSYDPNSLAVVVVKVGPEQRAIQDLFAPPRDDLDDVTLQPASLSAYLNLNLLQSYFWEGGGAQKPSINLDGAIRLGGVVFEGDAQIGNQFTIAGQSYGFERNYARFVYDQPKQYRRWFVGDLDPETRGQQSFVQMGGVGVLRQTRRFNAFRAAVLQGDRRLVLQRDASVRFLRNGVLYREVRLQPGSYDFSSLPLLSGSNDLQVEIRDNSGSVQTLSYQQYLDPIDLDPGEHEYGAFLGATSRQFGRAPDYRGQIAFTGFYRKAFLNRPAIGVGLQLSRRVQTVSGQTQFILGNGSRVLLDGAASNATFSGQGFSAGVAFDQAILRGGLSDNFSVRADYTSRRYATLGNNNGFNTIMASVSAQYTHEFSTRILTAASASYVKSRQTGSDSYRIGGNAFYRISDRWTLRAGADYAKFGSFALRGTGISFNLGLTFQPSFRRRVEARYESRDHLGELSYTQVGLGQFNSLGFGGVLARDDSTVRAQGFADYSANRFDVSISHASLGPSFSRVGQLNATTARVGTTIAFADGVIGLGRRVNDSFALVYPHENLGSHRAVAGQSISANDFIGRSGTLGAAVNNVLASYVLQSVQYDIQDAPTGYDIGSGVVRVRPPYRSGYKIKVGTDAFVSATGKLLSIDAKPSGLAGGRVTLLNLRTTEKPMTVPFFTNSVGRFAIASLLPGRQYVVEIYGSNGTINKAFTFTVPADTDGLVNLGEIRSGTANVQPVH